MELTDILAIWGSVVGTSALAWNFIRSRPNVKVEIMHSTWADAENKYHSGLGVEVMNVASVETHLSYVDVLCTMSRRTFWNWIKACARYRRITRTEGWVHYGISFAEGHPSTPLVLKPRTSAGFNIHEEAIELMLDSAYDRKIRAVVADGIWKRTYSNTFDAPKNRTSDVKTL